MTSAIGSVASRLWLTDGLGQSSGKVLLGSNFQFLKHDLVRFFSFQGFLSSCSNLVLMVPILVDFLYNLANLVMFRSG